MVPEVVEYRIKNWGLKITLDNAKPFEPDPAYVAATKKHAGEVKFDPKTGEATGYKAGMPFPNITMDDPYAGNKLLWNFYYGPMEGNRISLTFGYLLVDGDKGVERTQDWFFSRYGMKGMLDREPAGDVRRAIVQAISRSRLPEALPTLVALAKTDKDPATRGEALFWLAQSAGKAAAAEITAAIEHDPDTKVQERAVQALSQLPKDEGVPLLITVARTHRNAKVRERAMFWLGQSKDPRATKFFEEILIK